VLGGLIFGGLAQPLTRLLHASYTPLTRLLHASYTPLTRLLHASYTPLPLTRLLYASYTPTGAGRVYLRVHRAQPLTRALPAAGALALLRRY
jgi:hypothetical protein